MRRIQSSGKTKGKNKRDLSVARDDLHNEREDFPKANKGFASLNEICIAGLTNIFLGHVHTVVRRDAA